MDNQHHHVLFYIDLAFYDASNKSTTSSEFPIYQPMKSNFPDLILAIDQMNDRSTIIVLIFFNSLANGRGNQSDTKKIEKNRRKYPQDFFCRRIKVNCVENARVVGFSSLKISSTSCWSQIWHWKHAELTGKAITKL